MNFYLKVEDMKLLKLISGILIGAAAGFLYYKFIGCRTGT